MSKQLSDERLRSMNLERVDGLIRPIGTNVSPAVKQAEQAAENKPKHLDSITGYDVASVDNDFSDAMHTQVPEEEPEYPELDTQIEFKEGEMFDGQEHSAIHIDEFSQWEAPKPSLIERTAQHMEDIYKANRKMKAAINNVPNIKVSTDPQDLAKFPAADVVISVDRPPIKDFTSITVADSSEESKGLQPGKWAVTTDGFEVERGNLEWADEEKTKVNFVPDKKAPRRRGKAPVQEIKIDVMKQYMAGVDPAYGSEPSQAMIIDTKGIAYSGGRETDLAFPHLIEEMRNYQPPSLLEKPRCFVGIDNGVSGSIGIIKDDGTYLFYKTPVINQQDYTKEKKMINRINTLELYRILAICGPGSMVMIERPMVNPGMFNATMSAVRAYEATITVLEALRLPYSVTDSKAFQKELLPIGSKGPELKTASLSVGKRLFPDTIPVKHPDRDGMLIAALCKKLHK